MVLNLALAFLLQLQAAAVPPKLFPEAVARDTKIPDLVRVTGHDWGTEITTPEQITTYLMALAAAAPDRTRLIPYGETWEGRPLHVLAIASPERMSQLDRNKRDLLRLADPRKLNQSEVDSLVRNLPVVTWLMAGVHGNELSSPDAALAGAYYLLSARQDAAVDAALRESVVLVDPLQNPDGRSRFVSQFLLNRAAVPDPEPASAEHDELWPGGRSNHYLFDMNRDWFAQTQPETKGKVKLYLEWQPHVVVDLHEMGGDSTYYFAPPAAPLNPHITKSQIEWFDVFGRENAKRFDARGFAYFNREVFDSFYPGYGESWPIFQGAVGMTYEQASARGLNYRRSGGTLLTFLDGVVHHFTAAMATIETAARNREKLLRDFAAYRTSAVRDGEAGNLREYAVPPGSDPSRTRRLAELLARQGIEVRVAAAQFPVGSRTLPAGTFLVSTAQPAGRLLRNLMDPHTAQPEAFVNEQDRRRKKRLGDEIYDVTAWSLPHAFDVEVVLCDKPAAVASSPLGAAASRPAALPKAQVAYLLPWSSGTAAAVVSALRQGLTVSTADAPFTLAGRRYPLGTAVIRTAGNPADLAARLAAIAESRGAEVVAVDGSYVEDGPSLGSERMRALRSPRVLMAWDNPVSSLAAGWSRFVLERRFEQPVTAVRTGSLARVDFNRYDVLVLPPGEYSPVIGGELLRKIKDWVAAGGTIVTLGEASRWATREAVGLLSTRTELRDGRPESDAPEKDSKKAEPPPKPFDLEKTILPEKERPENTPGAMMRVELDTEHWLSAGTDGEIQSIVEGRRVLTPVKLDQGTNVGLYAPADRILAGGLVWNEAKELLARKAFLIHQRAGRGHVIAFAEDPNYRAFMEATELLFINAVLLGPAH
jgi:hypothetical protein